MTRKGRRAGDRRRPRRGFPPPLPPGEVVRAQPGRVRANVGSAPSYRAGWLRKFKAILTFTLTPALSLRERAESGRAFAAGRSCSSRSTHPVLCRPPDQFAWRNLWQQKSRTAEGVPCGLAEEETRLGWASSAGAEGGPVFGERRPVTAWVPSFVPRTTCRLRTARRRHLPWEPTALVGT